MARTITEIKEELVQVVREVVQQVEERFECKVTYHFDDIDVLEVIFFTREQLTDEVYTEEAYAALGGVDGAMIYMAGIPLIMNNPFLPE